MAAADRNFRLSDINLPDLQLRQGENVMPQLFAWLNEFKQAIIARDNELKNKINQLHIEYVTSVPSGAPQDPEPVFRIYRSGSNYYLYTYINSVWRSVQLT